MRRTILVGIILLSAFILNNFLLAQSNMPLVKASLDVAYPESGKIDMWACCKGFCAKNLKASSFLKNNTGINYEPKNLADDDQNTAWVEGKSGDGIAEFIEFDYSYDIKYIEAADGACMYKDYFYILNGYQKNEQIWKENNRVKKMKMYINGKETCYIDLLDKMGFQLMKLNFIKPLGKKKNTIKIRFEIVEIYKGMKFEDTAISAIFW